MTKEKLQIIQHSLGCNEYGECGREYRDEDDGCFVYYRNRYVADPNPVLAEMVADGLLVDNGSVKVYGGMHYYKVTKAGMDAMLANAPRLTRAQKRYRAYLNSDSGMTFGQWLKAVAQMEKEKRDYAVGNKEQKGTH
jgi:hypothetical protein